ncbi:MAG: sugar transferase [Syntrophomonadaceae bacterium]|nr:sugar transferase [Syntrophomonadaceae bacterium]MDH7497697.1 sugar transferase [Syntrophomonadaceae bacterium]
MLNARQRFFKRAFDILAATAALAVLWWGIPPVWLLARLSTGDTGFFTQTRVGMKGKYFRVIKFRTMRRVPGKDGTVTTARDERITGIGRVLRRWKIDELPQLFNVLAGDMSIVGPRPDVPGFADALPEPERSIILSVRPGITGPAALKYRDEETILAQVEDPETYNREVIYPDKVRLNCEYVQHYSFVRDMWYILATLAGYRYPEIVRGEGEMS